MRTLSQVLSLDPLTRLRSGKPSLPSGPTPSGSTPTTRPCVSLSVMCCSFSRNSRQPSVTAITALRDSRRPSRCDTSPPSDSIAFCSRSRERSGNPGRVVADEAGLEIALDLVGLGAGRFVGQAPDRVGVEIGEQRLGRRREADVAPRHVRGHVGDQVVGAERGLQEVLQRLADHHRVGAVDVIRVEEHDEHAPPRVGDHRVALGDRGRVAARQPTGSVVWRIASKERMAWTTPSSLTSKSAWVRSVTGLPSAVTKTSVRTKLASVRKVGSGGGCGGCCCPRTRPPGPAPARTQIPAATTSERTRRDVDMDMDGTLLQAALQ